MVCRKQARRGMETPCFNLSRMLVTCGCLDGCSCQRQLLTVSCLGSKHRGVSYGGGMEM